MLQNSQKAQTLSFTIKMEYGDMFHLILGWVIFQTFYKVFNKYRTD